MQAKLFFQKVQRAEAELKVLNAKRRHYIELGTSMGAPLGPVGGSHNPTSRVENSVIGMMDLTDKLDSKIREYEGVIREAEALIEKIPQEKYRQILTYRYLCGWSFKSISDEVGYTDPNSIYRSHGWALAEADKIMKEADRDDG